MKITTVLAAAIAFLASAAAPNMAYASDFNKLKGVTKGSAFACDSEKRMVELMKLDTINTVVHFMIDHETHCDIFDEGVLVAVQAARVEDGIVQVHAYGWATRIGSGGVKTRIPFTGAPGSEVWIRSSDVKFTNTEQLLGQGPQD